MDAEAVPVVIDGWIGAFEKEWKKADEFAKGIGSNDTGIAAAARLRQKPANLAAICCKWPRTVQVAESNGLLSKFCRRPQPSSVGSRLCVSIDEHGSPVQESFHRGSQPRSSQPRSISLKAVEASRIGI